MDQIGKQGVLFLNHYSNATYTVNSVPKYLFSRYYSLPVSRDASPNYDIRRESPATLIKDYDEQQILLPEVFSKNGYKTLLIHNNGWFDGNTYIAQKFDENIFLPSLIRDGKAPWEDKIIAELSSWLKNNRADNFFVYCHIMSPHSPYPEKESDEIFLSEIPYSEREAIRQIARKSETGQLPGKRWDEREIKVLKGLYDSNLHHTDLWIGNLFDKLEKLGLADKTLVVITSDHGEMLGEHDFYGHHKPEFDPQIRIPLIMRYPPLLPKDTRISGMTESVDVMPTILDICGLSLPKDKNMDGRSLMSYINDPTQTKAAVFTEAAVRIQDYKYITTPASMLFDLKSDPGEDTNLIDKEPELRRKMRKLHQQSLAPYKERYKNAVRKCPPEYIFYFSIDDFRITPESAYEKLAAWDESAAKMPWVLIRNKKNFGLYRLSDKGQTVPLTINSEFLDGTYDISILMESTGEIVVPPADFGFKFRYGDQSAFQEPLSIELFKKSGENYLYYLELGEMTVKDNTFSLEFDFSPQDSKPYVIRHVKFVPEKVRAYEKETASNDDEVEIRLKNLKALGYIR